MIKIKETVWKNSKRDYIDMSPKMKAFLNDLISVCQRHQLSISHEDHHGAFEINEYSDYDMQWILNAHDDITEN